MINFSTEYHKGKNMEENHAKFRKDLFSVYHGGSLRISA